jgi:nitrous oxidase accessory protein NosD
MSCGVSLLNCSSTEVVGNNITGIETENDGIRIRESENVYVKQNSVTGFGHSIDLGGSRFLTVENNSFVGAGHLGICLSYSCPGLGIHQNNILKSDSARYALYNYDITDWVHAESNWWGTANEDEVMTVIPQVQKILWEPISKNENLINFE